MQPTVHSEATPKERTKDALVRRQVHRAVSNAVSEILEAEEKRREEEAQRRAEPGTTPRPTPIARINKDIGQRISEAVTEIYFTAVLNNGYFRFSDGYGSLKVQRLSRTTMPKRLPSDKGKVEMPANRLKLKYQQGATVREGLGMPPQTSYRRQFERRSNLSAKTLAILRGDPAV